MASGHSAVLDSQCILYAKLAASISSIHPVAVNLLSRLESNDENSDGNLCNLTGVHNQ